MSGPFPLEREQLAQVPRRPGVYLLVYWARGRYRVRYVGRADKSLRNRLADWLGEYDSFYFIETDDEVEAFYLECHEYHRYGKSNLLDNEIHPARPKGWVRLLDLCSEYGCQGEAY